MSAVLFASAGVILSAAARTLFRAMLRSGGDVWALLLFDQLASSLLLVIVFFPLPIGALSLSSTALLLFSGVCWGIAPFFEMQAHKHLDVAVNEIIGAFRYILLMLAGIFLFGEKLSTENAIGVCLIVVSIIGASEPHSLHFRKGSVFKFVSIFVSAAALSNDKNLTGLLPVPLIAVGAFLVPGILIAVLKSKAFKGIMPEINRTGGKLLAAPLLLAGMYFCYLKAFEAGTLTATVSITQTTTVLSFLFGILFLNERRFIFRRAVASILCVAGAVMMNVG